MNYVIVRLVSGEQLMTVLAQETDNSIEIKDPMLIKTIPSYEEGRASEHVIAAPFCHLCADQNYTLQKSSVLFIKQMHNAIVPHYNRLVEEHSKTVLIKTNSDGSVQNADSLKWEEEEEELTVEEVRKHIDMLESILGIQRDDSETEEEIESVFIPGNKTLH